MDWIDLLFVATLVLAVIGIRPIGRNNCMNEAYLSIDTGKNLRGFFAVVVVCHHLAQRVDAGFLFQQFNHVGHLCVAVYFFLSGYGLQRSHMASESYKKHFLQRRLPKILLPYVTVTALFWVENMLNGVVYSLTDILWAILTGSPIVSFSWYIISICCFYIAYWVFMHICEKNNPMMILCAGLWFVVYLAICMLLGYGGWWYNTPQLLILGIAWACYEKEIVNRLTIHYKKAVWITAAAFIVAFILKSIIPLTPFPLLFTMLTGIFFVALVMLLSLKATIGNPVLRFLGDISLETYLIHGLWIEATRSNMLYIKNDSLWAFVVVAGSVLSAFILHLAFSGIIKCMDRLGKKKTIKH